MGGAAGLGATASNALAKLANVTFAAADPRQLAEFWAAALGYELQEAPPDFMEAWLAEGRDPNGAAAAVDPAGVGTRLFFNKRQKTPTIEVPIHLDVNVLDPDAEIERLLGLGARLVTRKTVTIGEFSEGWTVMRDPEGNGFCVQGPDRRAEEGPFVRNITFSCADPQRLADFWAQALGYSRQEGDDELLQQLLDTGLDPAEIDAEVALVHPEAGRRSRLYFQRRQKTPTTEIPVHVDLTAEDREAEVERLTALGASVVETTTRTTGPYEEVWTVMRDPEGNGFCVQ